MPQFYGQTYITPQVVSVVDDSRLVGPNDASGNTLALIGIATGGKPTTALEFFTARDARKALRGGELLDAVERAYAPGSGVAGAGRVLAVRVNAATQSTLTLKDATAGNAIVLTSADYGVHTNQLSVTLAAGTSSGTKITVQKAGTGTVPAVLVVQDNVGKSAIQMRYGTDLAGTPIGGTAGSAATVSVTYSGANANLTTTVTGASGDNLNIDLTAYTTLQQVVDQINAQGYYAAAIVGPDANAGSTTLDAVSAVDVKSASVTLRADLQAQIDFFNSLSDIMTAAKATNAHKPATTLVQTFFSGGGEGSTPNNSSWQAAFDALQTEDVQIVVPVTGDATLHAMANTHCQSMSAANAKKERVAIVGGVAGESVTQAKTRAVNLNSDRCQLVFPGGLDYSTDGLGTISTIPPYMIAAQKAGLSASLLPAQSATNKNLGLRGVELKLKPSEIDDLVYNGVTVVSQPSPRQGFKIVQDITTWQADRRYSRRELSTKVALDYTSRQLRDALSERIGQSNGPLLQAQVKADVTTVLDSLTRQGVLIGGPNVPSYTNLTVSAQGDVVQVSVQVSVAVPANFFFITIYPTVFSTPLPASN